MSRGPGRALLFDGEAAHHTAKASTRMHRSAVSKLVVPLDGASILARWSDGRTSSHREPLYVGADTAQALSCEGELVAFFFSPTKRAIRFGVQVLRGREADAARSLASCVARDPANAKDALNVLAMQLAADGVRPSARIADVALALEVLPARPSLDALAGRAALSPGRLSRLFRREVGVPLSRYAAHLRTARALGEMARGARPAAAALDAGFADQAHFTRTLRALFGRTPGELSARDKIVQYG